MKMIIDKEMLYSVEGKITPPLWAETGPTTNCLSSVVCKDIDRLVWIRVRKNTDHILDKRISIRITLQGINIR